MKPHLCCLLRSTVLGDWTIRKQKKKTILSAATLNNHEFIAF